MKAPEKFSGFWEQSNIFDELTDSDLNRFANEGCVQTWRQKSVESWVGRVDPATCTIYSNRRNVDIRIGADTAVSKTEYKTSERGFSMAMEQIWGSEPDELITLMRK